MKYLNPRAEDAKELLYILHKSAIEKNYRQIHYEKTQLINPYTVAQILISDTVISVIRREIRKLSEDMKLEPEEVKEMLISNVLKRDLIESDEAKEAEKMLKKIWKSAEKKAAKKECEKQVAQQEQSGSGTPEKSLTEKLLEDAANNPA